MRSSTPPWSFLESTSGPRQVELYPCPAFWRQGLLRMLKRLVGPSTPRVVPLRERPRVICYDHVFRCPPQTAAVFPLCPGRPDMYMWLSAPYAKARVLSFASVRLQPRQLGYLQSLQTSASRSALLCGVTLDVRNVVGFWPHERHFGYRQSRQRAPTSSVYCSFPLLAGDAELVQRKPSLQMKHITCFRL